MLIYFINDIKYWVNENVIPNYYYYDLFLKKLIHCMDQNRNIVLEGNKYGVKKF